MGKRLISKQQVTDEMQMINVQKFIDIRKARNLSQMSLCKGICTQSTLSKFENLGVVPSYNILVLLCERLGISLHDITITSFEEKSEKKMFDCEFALIVYDYKRIRSLLDSINEERFTNTQDLMHYYYLSGELALEDDKDYVKALYYFNSILTIPDLSSNSIYRVLALKGCSQIYGMEDKLKAERCYDEILLHALNVKIGTDQDVLQIMSVLTAAGEFYGENQMFRYSDRLLKYAYSVASQHHSVYFVARVLLQLGKNDIQQEKFEDAKQHLNDACAIARLNKNQVVVDGASQLLSELKSK